MYTDTTQAIFKRFNKRRLEHIPAAYTHVLNSHEKLLKHVG